MLNKGFVLLASLLAVNLGCASMKDAFNESRHREDQEEAARKEDPGQALWKEFEQKKEKSHQEAKKTSFNDEKLKYCNYKFGQRMGERHGSEMQRFRPLFDSFCDSREQEEFKVGYREGYNRGVKYYQQGRADFFFNLKRCYDAAYALGFKDSIEPISSRTQFSEPCDQRLEETLKGYEAGREAGKKSIEAR